MESISGSIGKITAGVYTEVVLCAACWSSAVPFFHQRIHIRHRHEDARAPACERLGDRELIEVARIIIVNGRPEQPAQIAHALRRSRRPADASDLLLRRRGKIGLQLAFDHRSPGN